MRRRLPYIVAFFVLLVIEIMIGLYVRDAFIRPYGGDILVTALLCCLARAIYPKLSPAVPVFIFACAVEFTQWLELAKLLGVEGTLIGVIIGSSFSWIDIICYGGGCLAFAAIEWGCARFTLKKA